MERDSQTGRFAMKFNVVYERGPRNYSAYVLNLPGCVATGKTLEETRKHIAEAIALHIETMRDFGEALPEPTDSVEELEVAV